MELAASSLIPRFKLIVKDYNDFAKLLKNIKILKELEIINYREGRGYRYNRYSKHLFQSNLEILKIEDDYPDFKSIVRLIEPLKKLKKFIL